ncbi:MAG: hypothetical protein AABW73_02850 [Nanoarchaeota archaeon]
MAKKVVSKTNNWSNACCNCNWLFSLIIIVLVWIPSIVAAQMWVKIVLSILAILLGSSRGTCGLHRMKEK